MKKPNLFVVGAAKCGTSALHDFLGQHPNIFMSSDKETFHFCPDIKRNHSTYDKEEDYLKLFNNWRLEKYAGESTPLYLYSKLAAKNIFKFNENAKIIIVVREPVSYLQSLHQQLLSTNQETITDLEKALLAEPKRKSGKLKVPKNIWANRLYYKERTKFTEQIKRFLKLFPQENVKILLYDEFRSDNQKTYQEILSFLQLKPFTPKFGIINPRSNTRSLFMKNLIESRFFWSLPKKILSGKKYNDLRKLYRKVNFIPVKTPELDKKIKKRIMKQYKNEVSSLGKLIKRDLITHWRYDKI